MKDVKIIPKNSDFNIRVPLCQSFIMVILACAFTYLIFTYFVFKQAEANKTYTIEDNALKEAFFFALMVLTQLYATYLHFWNDIPFFADAFEFSTHNLTTTFLYCFERILLIVTPTIQVSAILNFVFKFI